MPTDSQLQSVSDYVAQLSDSKLQSSLRDNLASLEETAGHTDDSSYIDFGWGDPSFPPSYCFVNLYPESKQAHVERLETYCQAYKKELAKRAVM